MLEPACGMRWPAARAPYTRLEALWNQRNFWACLQVSQQQPSAAAQGGSIMSWLLFDLADTTKWEALFLPLAPQVLAHSPRLRSFHAWGRRSIKAFTQTWSLVMFSCR